MVNVAYKMKYCTYTFNLATLAEGGATSGAATLGVINSFLKSSFVRAGLRNTKINKIFFKVLLHNYGTQILNKHETEVLE